MRNYLLILVSLFLLFVSCDKDDTIYYGDTTMVSYVNGAWVSDQGMTYYIVEQLCDDGYEEYSRALFYCDILGAANGKSDEFNIRLRSWSYVLSKDMLTESGLADYENDPGDDPIYVYSGWTSGGYVNLQCGMAYESSLGGTHLINLIYDDTSESADTLYFTLTHNGFGASDEPNVVSYFYFSVPYTAAMPDNVDEIPAKISYNWLTGYDSDGNLIRSPGSIVTTLKR